MLRGIEKHARSVAGDRWTRADVHRLIAAVEEDGIESRRERNAIARLIENDGIVRGGAEPRLVGRPKGELRAFLRFVDQVDAPVPRATLLGTKSRDIDAARYRRHVEILAGERSTELRGRTIVFEDRYLPSPTQQLELVADWLEDHYANLGIACERQPVSWRGREYANVIATIPGEREDAVLLCDHYDVADKEHVRPSKLVELERDHRLDPKSVAELRDRIPVGAAVPGADDNASATAALMEAGALLAGARLERTIKLVHLVGEELPASCLGARTYIARAKARREVIAGVIVLDMIGVDRTRRRKVQISPGRHPSSLAIAAEVKRASRDLELDLRLVLRPFGARKSFLHQTDGIQFSRAGHPVVLLNEHVNDDHDLYRAGYHDEFDVTALIDFDFAGDVTRAAIETAYRLANPQRGTERRASWRER